MSLRDTLFGRALTSSEGNKEQLTVFTGVPVLGLDALASTGYGPEAALTMLTPLGLLGLHYYPIIVIAIVVELALLYLSYRQTAAAYPDGGGAYVVAKDNFASRLAYGPLLHCCWIICSMLQSQSLRALLLWSRLFQRFRLTRSCSVSLFC